MSVDKDQLSRPELKKLIPVYEDFINAQGLTVKTLTGNQNMATPKRIINQGKTITSTKEIAELINNNNIEKIEEMRTHFKEPVIDPMEILKRTIPKHLNFKKQR